MKQKLLLALKTLFASKGFSQKALEGLADILVPNLTDESTTEEINAAIEGLAPMTAVMQAEINRQVNEAKRPKVEEPKPEPTPEPEPAKQSDPVLALLQELKGEIAAIKGEKVASNWKSRLEETVKDTKSEFKDTVLDFFNPSQFSDEESFNSFHEKVAERAKSFVEFQSDRPNGSKGGFTGTKKEATSAELDAVMPNLKF